MTDRTQWAAALIDAVPRHAASTQVDAEATYPVWVAPGLRLLWAVAGQVQGHDARGALWWQEVSEAVLQADFELYGVWPQHGGAQLGRGPGPPGPLPDTEELRDGALTLLTTARSTLARHAGQRYDDLTCRAAADLAEAGESR